MQMSNVWRFYWPIKGRFALVVLAESVAVVAVTVLPMGVLVSGTCHCITISVVCNAATVAASAIKYSKRISASMCNSKSVVVAAVTIVAVDVTDKVAKAEATVFIIYNDVCRAFLTYWQVIAIFTPHTSHLPPPVSHRTIPASQEESPASQEETPASQEEIPASQEETSACREETPASQEETPASQEKTPAS